MNTRQGWKLIVGVTLTIISCFPTSSFSATFTVTTPECGIGSFQEAIFLANNTPGIDNILFDNNMTVNFQCNLDGNERFPLIITESVNIEGNNSIIKGNQYYIGRNDGSVNAFFSADTDCPTNANSNYLPAGIAPGFISVGERGNDAQGIEVSVRDLSIQGMSGIAYVRQNGSLTLNNIEFKDIRNMLTCDEAPVLSDDGTVISLENITVSGSKVWSSFAGQAFILGGGQSGTRNSELQVKNSRFTTNFSGRLIDWDGDVRLESVLATNSGGIWNRNGNSQVINSLFSSFGAADEYDWLILENSDVDSIASTFSFSELNCDPSGLNSCSFFAGGPLQNSIAAIQAHNSRINFKESAVQVIYTGDTAYPTLLLQPLNGGSFSADEQTFIQPTTFLDASDLRTMTNQNSLITSNGLPNTSNYAEYIAIDGMSSVTPVLSGNIIDNIGQAGVGETNELLGIDGSGILKDVFLNSRIDENGKRSSGAVQVSYAPHITLIGKDKSIEVDFSSPSLPGLTHYEACYGEGASPSLDTNVCPGTLLSIPNPQTNSTTIVQLQNGQIYWVALRGVGNSSGPWSSTKQATPVATIDSPSINASQNTINSLLLSWNTPSEHGAGIAGYIIYKRVIGGQWETLPDIQASTINSLLIESLVPETRYEFGIRAIDNDGSISALESVVASTLPLEKADIVVSGGSISLLSLFVLVLFRQKRLFCVIYAALLTMFSWQASAEDDSKFQLVTGIGFGVIVPEVDGTGWKNENHHAVALKLGVDYEINQKWIAYVDYNLFNNVYLNSDNQYYDDTKIMYQNITLGTKYSFNEVFEKHTPYLILGVARHFPQITGSENLINEDSLNQVVFGFGWIFTSMMKTH